MGALALSNLIGGALGSFDKAMTAMAGDESGAGANHGDRVTGDALCNRVMIRLGRPRAEREKQEEPEEVFGSLAWRIREHKRRKRSSQYVWG